MTTEEHMDELEYSMEGILSTVLAEASPEVCLSVGREPTLVVEGQTTIMDVSPLSAKKIDAFFRGIATPAQVQQLKANGHVRFIYDFKTTTLKWHAAGRFRVEAKAANGHVVLLKGHSLPTEVEPK